MIMVRDDEGKITPGSTRVTTACAVFVWDTDAAFVAYGPSLTAGVENYQLVSSGDELAYRERQTAYVEGAG